MKDYSPQKRISPKRQSHDSSWKVQHTIPLLSDHFPSIGGHPAAQQNGVPAC
jgi:hypothetical protein